MSTTADGKKAADRKGEMADGVLPSEHFSASEVKPRSRGADDDKMPGQAGHDGGRRTADGLVAAG